MLHLASPGGVGTQVGKIIITGSTTGPDLLPAPRAHFGVLQCTGQAGSRCWGCKNAAVWVRAAWERQMQLGWRPAGSPPHTPARLQWRALLLPAN